MDKESARPATNMIGPGHIFPFQVKIAVHMDIWLCICNLLFQYGLYMAYKPPMSCATCTTHKHTQPPAYNIHTCRPTSRHRKYEVIPHTLLHTSQHTCTHCLYQGSYVWSHSPLLPYAYHTGGRRPTSSSSSHFIVVVFFLLSFLLFYFSLSSCLAVKPRAFAVSLSLAHSLILFLVGFYLNLHSLAHLVCLLFVQPSICLAPTNSPQQV